MEDNNKKIQNPFLSSDNVRSKILNPELRPLDKKKQIRFREWGNSEPRYSEIPVIEENSVIEEAMDWEVEESCAEIELEEESTEEEPFKEELLGSEEFIEIPELEESEEEPEEEFEEESEEEFEKEFEEVSESEEEFQEEVIKEEEPEEEYTEDEQLDEKFINIDNVVQEITEDTIAEVSKELPELEEFAYEKMSDPEEFAYEEILDSEDEPSQSMEENLPVAEEHKSNRIITNQVSTGFRAHEQQTLSSKSMFGSFKNRKRR